MSHEAGKNKKIIAESVKIFNDKTLLGPSFLKTHATTFRPTTYATCNMQVRNGGMAAWQNKIFHFGKHIIYAVHFFFQQLDILFLEIRNFHFWFFLGITCQ